MNISNVHWVLAAIHLQHQRFVYLDPMYGVDTHGVISKLRRWLIDELSDKLREDVALRWNISKWKTVCNPRYIPRQKDGVSCGVFSLLMADYLELSQFLDFTQVGIPVLRQRAALFLRSGTLPQQ